VGTADLDTLGVEDTGHLVQVPSYGGHPGLALVTEPLLTLGPTLASPDPAGSGSESPDDLRFQASQDLLVRRSESHGYEAHAILLARNE
jgi:hypothetical protein